MTRVQANFIKADFEHEYGQQCWFFRVEVAMKFDLTFYLMVYPRKLTPQLLEELVSYKGLSIKISSAYVNSF